MAGSKPLATHSFEKNPENKKMLKDCIDHLSSEGWKWYVDFYVDWGKRNWEFQVFNRKLVTPAKNLLFEKAF
jgi:hypothetical protein